MSISRDDAREMICKLLPHVESESRFLTPRPMQIISAARVFDTIRNMTEEPITEEEFNRIAEGCSR